MYISVLRKEVTFKMKTWNKLKEYDIDVFSDEEKKLMAFQVELVSKIIKKRKELGITQRKLAELTGIKQPAIARIESFRATPQIDTIFKMLQPLGLKLELVEEK